MHNQEQIYIEYDLENEDGLDHIHCGIGFGHVFHRIFLCTVTTIFLQMCLR